MKTLFILDPIQNLSLRYDSTLCLAREFCRRGHSSRVADVPDIFATEKCVFARTRPLQVLEFSKKSDPYLDGRKFRCGKPAIENLEYFDLILIRKEPPFDLNYLYLTYLLERLAGKVAVSNDPAGIRNHNEKLACFLLPKASPRSFVSCRVKDILDFQRTLKKDLVLKPLNDRAGYGIVRLGRRQKNAVNILRKATKGGTRTMLAQEFLGAGTEHSDKRITLLDGKVLFVYEKYSRGKEFRTNLSQGGIARPAQVSAKEEALLCKLRPHLKAHGLHVVGLDLLEDKLIDFNVTCPSGFWDAKALYPKSGPVEAWADFLESLVRA